MYSKINDVVQPIRLPGLDLCRRSQSQPPNTNHDTMAASGTHRFSGIHGSRTGVCPSASGTNNFTPPAKSWRSRLFPLTSTSSTAGFLLYPLSVRQFVRSSPSYSSHHVLDFHLPSCDALRPSFQRLQSFPIAPIPGAGPRCSGYQPPQLQHHLDAPFRCPR